MDPLVFYDANRAICSGFTVADVEAIQATGQPIREGLLYPCYKAMRLTDDCAFLHATSDVAGSYSCTEACLPILQSSASPRDFETCEPNVCLECESAGRGLEYDRWSGRSMYKSGLISYNELYQVKAECSVYQDNPIMNQNPFNPTKTLTDPPTNAAESAERFTPSYSLLLNQESCFYDFSFSMRHDPTLPNAGGWDPSLNNSVTREEFDARCARDTNVIADDGLPYRQRRMFNFTFGEDVNKITGIFDHISIDYNPCGHHDEIFFGRPHYDLHFYLVPEAYRDIMRCDTTECDPQDCKYDATFQSSESGKAFFEMGRCSEPFPSYLPDEALNAVKPGSFNRNMPFGFMPLAHTGNVRSGLHSLNLLTAQTWNETQVDRWDEPVQFYMSFNDNVVVWEPMVPVEFMQGSESRSFSSPETPPLCHTLAGLPLTYNANYNAESGFTTYQILGRSPFCACEGNPSSGALTSEQCAANEMELKKYEETYGGPLPTPANKTSPFGKFTVAEVEDAFGFTEGSLVLKGTEEFDTYTENNFWVEYIGLPLILTRLTPIVSTPRNTFQSQIAALGNPTFVYQEDLYYEQPLLGCFYRPKSEDTDMFLQANELGLCTGEPGAFTGIIVPYYVVGYIDQYTRLLYFGTLPEFADDIQFMTQLVVAEIQKDATLADGEIFVYQLKGPSFGAYDGFADPDIEAFNFLGNHGHFEVAVTVADLNENCPDEYCGNIVTGLPNELAPDAPWPTKILDNQCIWFPCDEIDDCADVDPSVSPFYEQCGRKFIPDIEIEECFEPPSNHFMGLFNFEAPWPIQCTLCAVDGEEACFGQPCWCAPEGGSSGCCPDPGERPLYYEFQVADAFRANKLTLSNDTKFTPEGCEPWDINVEVTFPGATKCDAFPLVDNPDAVCAFIYPEDDQDCGGLDPREYGMQSFESYDAAIAANAVPTHLGGKC
jgi:hypothetical protein